MPLCTPLLRTPVFQARCGSAVNGKSPTRRRWPFLFARRRISLRAGRFFLLAGMGSLHTGGRRIRRAFFVCRRRNFLPAELTGEPLSLLAGKARRHPSAALCGERQRRAAGTPGSLQEETRERRRAEKEHVSRTGSGRIRRAGTQATARRAGGRAPVPSVADRTCRQEKRKERRPQRPTPCTEETDSLRESWRKPLDRAGSPKARPARRLAVVTASC